MKRKIWEEENKRQELGYYSSIPKPATKAELFGGKSCEGDKPYSSLFISTNIFSVSGSFSEDSPTSNSMIYFDVKCHFD